METRTDTRPHRSSEPPSPAPSRRRRWLALAVVVPVLLAAAGLWFQLYFGR